MGLDSLFFAYPNSHPRRDSCQGPGGRDDSSCLLIVKGHTNRTAQIVERFLHSPFATRQSAPNGRNTEWVWYAAYGLISATNSFSPTSGAGHEPIQRKPMSGARISLSRSMPFLSQFHNRLFFCWKVWLESPSDGIRPFNKTRQSYGRLFLIAFPQFDRYSQQERGASLYRSNRFASAFVYH